MNFKHARIARTPASARSASKSTPARYASTCAGNRLPGVQGGWPQDSCGVGMRGGGAEHKPRAGRGREVGARAHPLGRFLHGGGVELAPPHPVLAGAAQPLRVVAHAKDDLERRARRRQRLEGAPALEASVDSVVLRLVRRLLRRRLALAYRCAQHTDAQVGHSLPLAGTLGIRARSPASTRASPAHLLRRAARRSRRPPGTPSPAQATGCRARKGAGHRTAVVLG